MTSLTKQIYLVEQIREIEKLAAERFNISNQDLMERAGQAAFNYLKQLWPQAQRIAVICGAGNNGGDGYVLARIAYEHGLKVSIWQVGDIQRFTELTRLAYDTCKQLGIRIHSFENYIDLHDVEVVVDALFGIGLKDKVSRRVLYLFEAINNSKIPVLALDVPSGINANTGAKNISAIKAFATITFIGNKLGLFTGAGIAHVGKLQCSTLDLPDKIFASISPKIDVIKIKDYKDFLKPRPKDMHKGDAGHVLIVGGEPGHSGAVLMAGLAALRIGAGLVTIATHPSHAHVLNINAPEIMCRGIRLATTLNPFLEKATVVVIGPGLGQTYWSKHLLNKVLLCDKPLVVDADALNLLAKKPVNKNNWILTPHPGEAARLLGETSEMIQNNRLNSLIQIQQKFDGVCVLKGAGTLVLAPNELPSICTTGNPGMASGGMGDILSGIIGGLLAQGLSVAAAAKLGVWLHGRAADLAVEQDGERGLLATDLLPRLRQLINNGF